MAMTKEAADALKAVASRAGLGDEQRSAFAQLIVETIEPNRITLDLFSSFLPVRSLGYGDQLVKRVRNRGLPVRTMVPGVEHIADQFLGDKEIYTYQLDTMIVKIGYSLWEIRRGEVGSLEQFRREMSSALIDNLVSRVWNLIATVWNASNTPNNYATVAGQVDEATIQNMIETVIDEAGQVRAIVGTRKALDPLYRIAGIVEHIVTGGTAPGNTHVLQVQSILEEWRRTGRVTTWRGIPLIELPQILEHTADNYDKKLIREDLILVIGDTAGEIVVYGDLETQENVNKMVEPATYTLAMWQSWGMIIDEPKRIGIIQIV